MDTNNQQRNTTFMKNKRLAYERTFSLLLITLLFQQVSFAAPDFPPREKGPVQPVTAEQAEAHDALPRENLTPESAKTGRVAESTISEIKITVLFGNNQKGEKSYKIDQKVTEVREGDAEKKDPLIKVSFKNKADKEKYNVSEVFVKKTKSGTYKITAEIDELKEGEEKSDTKITYID